MTTYELSRWFGIGVRRIQQLSKAGILPCSDRGQYNDPAACTRAYIKYLKDWQSKTEMPVSMADLAKCCGTTQAKISVLVRKKMIPKLGRGRYDLVTGVRTFVHHYKS